MALEVAKFIAALLFAVCYLHSISGTQHDIYDHEFAAAITAAVRYKISLHRVPQAIAKPVSQQLSEFYHNVTQQLYDSNDARQFETLLSLILNSFLQKSMLLHNLRGIVDYAFETWQSFDENSLTMGGLTHLTELAMYGIAVPSKEEWQEKMIGHLTRLHGNMNNEDTHNVQRIVYAHFVSASILHAERALKTPSEHKAGMIKDFVQFLGLYGQLHNIFGCSLTLDKGLKIITLKLYMLSYGLEQNSTAAIDHFDHSELMKKARNQLIKRLVITEEEPPFHGLLDMLPLLSVHEKEKLIKAADAVFVLLEVRNDFHLLCARTLADDLSEMYEEAVPKPKYVTDFVTRLLSHAVSKRE